MSFEQVKEFNETFQVKLRDTAAVRVPESKLRYSLIKEEFKELLDAIETCDIVEFADALGDIKVVLIGAAQVFGISEHVQSLAQQVSEQFDFDSLSGDNELLTAEGQDRVLKSLAQGILSNNIDSVSVDLASILVVVDFTAEQYDIDLAQVVTAIHGSNMSKLDIDGQPIFRESDGKIMKGPHYQTPTAHIEDLLFFGNFGSTDVDTEN